MGLTELNVKVQDLENLINVVKENSHHNITLFASILGVVVAILSLIGFSTMKSMVKSKFDDFYEQNMESLRTEIRLETKRVLASTEFKQDLIQEVIGTIFYSDTMRITPTFLSGAISAKNHKPAYWKERKNFILFDMELIVQYSDSIMFILASGYRPVDDCMIVVPIKMKSGDIKTGFLKIDKKGQVSVSGVHNGDTVLLKNIFLLFLNTVITASKMYQLGDNFYQSWRRNVPVSARLFTTKASCIM